MSKSRGPGRDNTILKDPAAMVGHESHLWSAGCARIAGIDEAGVGPLAGPVVAAAVVFSPDRLPAGINDSKKLSPRVRLRLAERISDEALDLAVGIASVEEIDSLNIYRAGLLAMRRAVTGLSEPPDHLLIDARPLSDLPIPQISLIKGDQLSISIAAASIIAKTRRDRMMCELDEKYPGYGFAVHMGYPTARHREALGKLGPSPVHRKSFPAVREFSHSSAVAYSRLLAQLDEVATVSQLECFRSSLRNAKQSLQPAEYRRLAGLARRRRKAGAFQNLLPGFDEDV